MRAVACVAIDEVQQRVPDAFDRRDIQLHRAWMHVHAPCALLHSALVCERSVFDAKGNRADRRAVHAREALRERTGLGIQDEMDESATEQAAALKSGEILLLENLRFYKQEEKGDVDFAEKLSKLGDVWVMDAFGTDRKSVV